MADLDRFKMTNDRYGHVAGDRVIVESVAGMTGAVATATWWDVWAGTSSWCGLVGHFLTRSRSWRRSRSACAAVSKAAGGEADYGPVSSLGIALYPQDGATYEELYRNADRSYRAKRAGGGSYAFFCDRAEAP